MFQLPKTSINIFDISETLAHQLKITLRGHTVICSPVDLPSPPQSLVAFAPKIPPHSLFLRLIAIIPPSFSVRPQNVAQSAISPPPLLE
jgi:hypothetical protein